MKIWIYMSLNVVIQNRSDDSSSIHTQKLCAKFEPIWSNRTTQVPPSGNQGVTAFPTMKLPVYVNVNQIWQNKSKSLNFFYFRSLDFGLIFRLFLVL